MTENAKDSIKVVNDFLSSEDLDTIINYINDMVETKPEEFINIEETGRLILAFADEQEEDFKDQSHLTLDLLGNNETLFRGHMSKILQTVKDLYNDDAKLYITCLWFTKQIPGSAIPSHEDTTEERNPHFKYSVLLYLNGSDETGEIEFPDLDYKHKPAAGDLVMFPSVGLGEHKVDAINYERYAMAVWITEDRSLSIHE